MSTAPRYKLVVAGPVGAGKTTAIASVSDIAPVTTEERATDSTRFLKRSTTVAMDFGVLHLDGAELHLYGTPGQGRFDFMWDILSAGAVGLLLLVPATAPDPAAALAPYLEAFSRNLEQTPVAVGVTHTDLHPAFDPQPIADALARAGWIGPVLSVDPRSKEDVSLLLEALVASIAPELV